MTRCVDGSRFCFALLCCAWLRASAPMLGHVQAPGAVTLPPEVACCMDVVVYLGTCLPR